MQASVENDDSASVEAAERAAEDAFQREMEEMEANEKWEKSITSIPEEDGIRAGFQEVMTMYSVFLKIKVYKLLALLEWSADNCGKLLSILIAARDDAHASNPKIDWFFDKLSQYEEAGFLHFAFSLFARINAKVIVEIFTVTTDVELDRLMDLARFLPHGELDLLIEFLFELSITEVLSAMDRSNEPFVKACRLCRTRRVNALEQRLIHDQVPDKMIRVTGALAIYDKSESWQADDEKGFTFDAEKGQIFWEKQQVDLMKICDKCLLDVHGAASSDGRFDDLHNIPATERKAAIKALRNREQQLAKLIGKISKERVNRRTKEFAIRAISTQRLGHRHEMEDKERKALEIKNEETRLDKERKNNDMLTAAGAVEKKWRGENKVREEKDLSIRVHTSNLNYHLGYTRENPAPVTREHPSSWNYAHYLEDGTPMSPVAAKERFGTYEIVPDEQHEQLIEWKQRAMESHEDFLKRTDAYKAQQREAELNRYNERIEYVDKRLKRLVRKEQKLGRTLALEEQARLDKRKADRAARAAIRYAKMEANERFEMEIEDEFSNQARFYEWESIQIDREREGMWYEECEQTSTDRFWGFHIEESRIAAVNQKYIDFYNGRIKETRAKLILSKQIRPFKIEADMKIFKNPFTGEVLK